MTNTPKQTISSEVDYDKGYRFRLWVTAVEDSATLGMGFNAYHSHILRSLEAWQQQGFQFINPNEKAINFDALTKDDLFGFLGKKNSNMTGPGRNIKNFKLAVLDVFLKLKCPKLLPFFRNSDNVTSIRAALLDFHNAREPQSWEFQRAFNLISEGEMLFVYNPTVDQITDIHDGLGLDYFCHYIQIYHLSLRENSKTINIKKLRVPIHDKMLKKESEAHEHVSKKQLRYDYLEGIEIYEGFGIPAEFKGDHVYNHEIACILREKLLHRPFYQTIFINVITNAVDNKYIFNLREFNFNNINPIHILCDELDSRYENNYWIYSDKFIIDIKSLIRKNGSEI